MYFNRSRCRLEPHTSIDLVSLLYQSSASPFMLMRLLVGLTGYDPVASTVSAWRSNQMSYSPLFYFVSQRWDSNPRCSHYVILPYKGSPFVRLGTLAYFVGMRYISLVVLIGNDPIASTLSVWRSNHLSYRTILFFHMMYFCMTSITHQNTFIYFFF